MPRANRSIENFPTTDRRENGRCRTEMEKKVKSEYDSVLLEQNLLGDVWGFLKPRKNICLNVSFINYLMDECIFVRKTLRFPLFEPSFNLFLPVDVVNLEVQPIRGDLMKFVAAAFAAVVVASLLLVPSRSSRVVDLLYGDVERCCAVDDALKLVLLTRGGVAEMLFAVCLLPAFN
ncbi:hypothetical protein HELRODRAFT_159168 [Helobdella robusta]|uniref:Uncharacterized protein n=1 Tax=Helobdella robusta TaxID=6412 RepID=T1ENP5_HELRO|nr:hypothetical protein HELRODRAFT_159168 [Helobdella robusta]ESO12605.1 hypothetical protein HELRODRAFT_159168 [Helobdella robusta]